MPKTITIAEFITERIDVSSKTQLEIAREAGYENPNFITMLKQGKTKLPLNAVGPIAHALDADPVHLLRLALGEYMPETFAAIENVLGTTILTEHERQLIDQFREATKGKNPRPLVFANHVLAVMFADR